MDDGETRALRTDERRLEATVIQLLRCVASYILWDKERRREIRSHTGMRKLDKNT
jgi:hypothetical protein